MKKVVKKSLFALSALLNLTGWAQEGRYTGMGNASVMLPDFWSAFGNQSGLAYLEHPEIGASYYNAYQLWELGTQAGAFVYPTRTGNFAASLHRTGYSLFSKNQMGLAYARKLGEKWSASVQFDYLYYHQSEQTQHKGAFLIEAGVMAEPIDGFFIGAHVYNPTRVKLSDYQDERVPTLMKAGLGYYFSQWVVVTLEAEKDLEFKPRVKCGVEYQAVTHLFLRMGLMTQPNQFTLGLGYQLKNLTTDIAFVTHETLPLSTQISLKYSFK